MKLAVFLTLFATAAAFVPAAQKASTTALNAEKKNFFANAIFGMDLFAPNPTVNDYGSRGKKNLKQGTIGSNSYVPDGLTAAQYTALRNAEQKKKDDNYARNVKKAGKFEDFTEFYLKRGTDLNQAWIKRVDNGHKMVKTKFDWSGKKDTTKGFESFVKGGKK